MNIEYLKNVVRNKINNLNQQKERFFEVGDLTGVELIELEITAAQITLSQLETL